jgi:hypothetical protein
MSERHDMGDFEQRARMAFDASVEGIDAQTRSQLNRARQAALAELERHERTGLRAWLPAGALAATAALALVLWQMPNDGSSPDDVATSAAALAELPASDEDLDLVTEDPEFYAWSAQQASLVTNGSG